MTEEEKKEFEEFLKWKEERAKKEENKPTEVESKSVDNQQSSVLVDNDKVEGNNNTGIILAFVAVAMLILVFVVFGFAEKRTPTLDETEIVVDSEIVEVVEPATPETTKSTWDFTFDKDQLTDSKNIWASITSDNYITQEFPYNGQTRAIITVRYMKKYGFDVIIQISQGQMNGTQYYGTDYITARFDKGSAKKYYFNESADGDSKVVFLRKSSEFIKNCKSAKDIVIDIPLYQGGRPVFNFHVDEPLTWREE